MEQRNEKKIVVFKIIAFEPNQQIVLFLNRILLIGSQYVTKQP